MNSPPTNVSESVVYVDTASGKSIPARGFWPKKLEKAGRPIIFCPGWTDNAKLARNFMSTLASHSRFVIGLDCYHGAKTGFSDCVSRSAQSLADLVAYLTCGEVDLVAHSYGSLYATQFGVGGMDQVTIKNLVFVCPAGLCGSDTFMAIATRFSVEVAKQSLSSFAGAWHMTKSTCHTVKASACNPSETIRQIAAMARTSIVPKLDVLLSKGTNIAVVHPNPSDGAFPSDRIRSSAPTNVSHYDLTCHGGHFALFINPKEMAQKVSSIAT